jgi:plasmid stabilization system protein ParE
MTQGNVRIRFGPRALTDIERLESYLLESQDELHGALMEFLFAAMSVLRLQPGVGRPVLAGLYRELIVERGHSGYLVRYHYARDTRDVSILRIRHQRECGYSEADIEDEFDF